MLSFSENILVSARIFWSKGAKICERLFLVPRLPLSPQTNRQSWYFLCLQIQHLSKKQSEDESSSSIVTVEHSRVLDIIVEKFLPPPHSSHLQMFRRQFRVSVKSSAIALDSRIRLNCVQSSIARLVIHARIDSQHCLSLFVLLTFWSATASIYAAESDSSHF